MTLDQMCEAEAVRAIFDGASRFVDGRKAFGKPVGAANVFSIDPNVLVFVAFGSWSMRVSFRPGLAAASVAEALEAAALMAKGMDTEGDGRGVEGYDAIVTVRGRKPGDACEVNPLAGYDCEKHGHLLRMVNPSPIDGWNCHECIGCKTPLYSKSGHFGIHPLTGECLLSDKMKLRVFGECRPS